MEVKGTAISPIVNLIKEKYGEGGFKNWLDSLEPEAREVYRQEILVSSWYDFIKIYHEPMVKFCEMFYPTQKNEGAREIGRYSAEYSLHGIYSIFLKIGSPAFLVKKASTILPTYYKPSKLEVKNMTDKSASLLITEFDGITDLAEHRIAGYMEKALEVAGGKNPKLTIIKSLAAGDSYTEYDSTWK